MKKYPSKHCSDWSFYKVIVDGEVYSFICTEKGLHQAVDFAREKESTVYAIQYDGGIRKVWEPKQ